ncbi:hypothetical protein LAZ40_11465 [Cereibacter sphaeroides]|uniref:hypothetical protein n=1 Tax=Cereibacter sphaeroides TaxID=1063 RepID=UPI001F1DFBD0|nr:hypothetical protein [Cereibacter sphaeroides]MCE6959636.1 hypothetical protein [Cereibacter sphaeroides]MCE6974503.1 hypothetical protein [Cereibacter sphaeroides]
MRPAIPSDPFHVTAGDIAGLAAVAAIEGSDIDLARGVIGLARGLRRECVGQRPGVPDLRKPDASFESLLAWELLPELAARLMARTGATFVRSREETAVPSLAVFSDADLRRSFGEAMRSCRFGEVADTLRRHAAPDEIQPGRLLACEIASQDLSCGNIVEIACSRLVPEPAPGTPGAEDDLLAIDRRRSLRADPALEADFTCN